MTKVISLFTTKGGEGKTYIAQHISALAAVSGYRVAIVDIDTSAYLTKNLIRMQYPDEPIHSDDGPEGANNFRHFINAWSSEYLSANDLFSMNALDKPVLSLPVDGDASVDLVIGNMVTQEVHHDAPYALRESLKYLAENHRWDYVFFDMGPNKALSSQSVLLSSTDIGVIVKPELQSVDALNELMNMLQEYQTIRQSEGTAFNFLGILLNNIDKREKVSVQTATAIRERYENCLDIALTSRQTIKITPGKGFVWEFAGSSAEAATSEITTAWNEIERGLTSSASPAIESFPEYRA